MPEKEKTSSKAPPKSSKKSVKPPVKKKVDGQPAKTTPAKTKQPAPKTKKPAPKKDKRPVLYLHVGLDKTGTSALQEIFAGNALYLREQGILYPVSGRNSTNQHHDFFSQISTLSDAENYNLSGKTYSEHLSDLAAEIENFNGNAVLMSSEMLTQGIDMVRMSHLKALFSSVTVVIYLRRQEDYLASVYRQRVKAGTEYRHFDLSALPRANYLEVCQTWAGFAYGGKFFARLFQKEHLVDGSIGSDFFDAIGHQNLVPHLTVPERNSNPRLTNDCMEFKRLVNASCPPALHKHLIRPLELYSRNSSSSVYDKFSKDHYFTKSKRKEIADLFRDNNRKTALNFFGKDIDLFEQVPGSVAEATAYEGLTEFAALEIASNLADYIPDIPVPAHIQRALADALSIICESLVPLIPENIQDNGEAGSRLVFDEEFVSKCLFVKTDLARRCATIDDRQV